MQKSLFSILFAAAVSFMVMGSNVVLAKAGYAVYYSNKYQGKKTASSEIFDQNKLTAAHKKLPFGTKVKVTNLENDHSVIVKINDRMATGPINHSNVIDLSMRAAEELGFIKQGRARVSLEAVD